jgi:hypothetical protein
LPTAADELASSLKPIWFEGIVPVRFRRTKTGCDPVALRKLVVTPTGGAVDRVTFTWIDCPAVRPVTTTVISVWVLVWPANTGPRFPAGLVAITIAGAARPEN